MKASDCSHIQSEGGNTDKLQNDPAPGQPGGDHEDNTGFSPLTLPFLGKMTLENKPKQECFSWIPGISFQNELLK